MKTQSHIDSAGRIVIPKALRRRYGLESGQRIRFIPGAEGIIIAPEDYPQRRFIQRGPLLTLDTGSGPAPLETFAVQRIRAEQLDGKSDENWG